MNRNPVKRKEERLPVIFYTLLFAGLALLVFSHFFLTGRSFVRNGDGLNQHIKALSYYGKWLRQIFTGIVRDHRLSVPAWSFSLGLGADVVTTLHYYVIGDPLNLVSVLVPQSHTAYLYGALILLRLYLAGLSFLYFCAYRGKRDRAACLAGAMIYVFCAYTMFAGIRHPYFSNPMIWFPLILTGICRIRDEGRSGLFAVAVCMSALSNFYFFYMIVLLTVCYVVWQMLFFRDAMMDGTWRFLRRVCLFSVLGLSMSAALFLPVVRVFLESTRGMRGAMPDLLYPVSYYAVLSGSFTGYFGPGEFTYLGYTFMAVPAFACLFLREKKDMPLKVLAGAFALLLLFPIGGFALNGFTYVMNRWTWALSLFTAWIVVETWQQLLHASRRQWMVMLACLLILALPVAFYVRNMRWNVASQLLLGIVVLVCLHRFADAHRKRILLCAAVCFGVCLNAWFAYDGRWGAYAEEFCSLKSVTGENLVNSEADAVRLLDRKDPGTFTRFSGNHLTSNASLLTGTHATQFYWSLANGYQESFLAQMANREYLGYYYEGFDERTALNAVTGVAYYSSKDPDAVPFGFERISPEENEEDEKWPLYRNRYALPLVIPFSSAVSEQQMQGADPFVRQTVMLSDVILDAEAGAGERPGDDGTRKEPAWDPGDDVVYRDWELSVASGNVQIGDGQVHAAEDGAVIRLSFERTPDSETGFFFAGGDFKPEKTDRDMGLLERIRKRTWKKIEELKIGVDVIEDEEAVVHKDLVIHTSEHEWFNGRRDFLVNGCYSAAGTQAFEITLPYAGTYSWKELKVASCTMGRYPEKIAALQSGEVAAVELNADPETAATDTVQTDVALSAGKWLLFSIPYDRGWSATIDGESAPVIRADGMFMAVRAPQGEHTVRLRYRCAGGREGLLISAAGWMIYAAAWLCSRRRRKQSRA